MTDITNPTDLLRYRTVSFSGTDPVADALVARAAIEDNDVVWMQPTHVPDPLRGYYDDLVEAIGTPISAGEDYANGGVATGERWSEIKYDATIPDNLAFRYSKNAQPLHTDESYVPTAAGVMLFYCVHAAPAGGETVFISGRRIVDSLTEHDPDLLRRLQSIPVTFRKADRWKTRPIVDVDERDRVRLNYNYFCADPDQPSEALALNEEFYQFVENALAPNDLFAVSLEPGQAVAWKDEFVLHGRNSFEARDTGDRHIWKTSIQLPTRAL